MVNAYLRKVLLFITLGLSLLLASPVKEEKPKDPWFAFDKVQHFTFACLISLSTQYVLVNKMAMQKNEAIIISSSVSLIAGVGKELYDRNKPKGFFSRRDLIADLLGLGFAVYIIGLPSKA
jgi:uncharacterized protein YfiM (DUF2279 family)